MYQVLSRVVLGTCMICQHIGQMYIATLSKSYLNARDECCRAYGLVHRRIQTDINYRHDASTDILTWRILELCRGGPEEWQNIRVEFVIQAKLCLREF